MDIKALIAEAVEQAIKSQSQQTKQPDWMSPAQAASYLGVTAQHLQNLRARRKGPTFVKFGRLVRYARADLDAYLAARKVETDGR